MSGVDRNAQDSTAADVLMSEPMYTHRDSGFLYETEHSPNPLAVFANPEHAKRIVACVTACLGVPTHELENRGACAVYEHVQSAEFAEIEALRELCDRADIELDQDEERDTWEWSDDAGNAHPHFLTVREAAIAGLSTVLGVEPPRRTNDATAMSDFISRVETVLDAQRPSP